MNSKQKGNRFEREVAKLLNKWFGCDLHRTAQTEHYHQKADIQKKWGSKVTVADDWHFEAKHYKRISVYDWIEQAQRDCRQGKIPIVIAKANNKEPIVIMTANDWAGREQEIQESRLGPPYPLFACCFAPECSQLEGTG